jgi:hypothetical protein
VSKDLPTEEIDLLPPERQAQIYRERLIQMTDLFAEIMPLARDRDFADLSDDEPLSARIGHLVDLNKSVWRTLKLPSWHFHGANLPENLSKMDQWQACLDLVVEINREWGVHTRSEYEASTHIGDFWKGGKVARDPLEPEIFQPKTFGFRVLAMIFGEARLQRFVNRNSQYYRPTWRADVTDKHHQTAQ